MKYLKIHIALWWLICLIIVTIQFLFFSIASIFYFIWNLKLLKWGQFHKVEHLIVKSEDTENGLAADEYIATEFISFETPIHSFLYYINFFKDI